MLIAASVGSSGINRRDDVALIQFLLNDWRQRNGRRRIAEDGLVGPETIAAIRDFQGTVTHLVDGRIDSAGPSMTALERMPAAATIRTVASTLLTYLTGLQRDLDRFGGCPPDLRRTIHQLSNEALAAGGTIRPIQVTIGAGRRPLLAFATGGSGPRVIGLAIPVPVILLILAAIVLILLAIRAAIESGRTDPKTQHWMENIADELGKKVVELVEETNDIARRFDRCFGKLITRSLDCEKAIAVFLGLQSIVRAKQARVIQLSTKIGLDIHDKKPVNPAELSELQNLVNELNQLIPKLESALEDVIEKCGCRDE